ncbi:MAG: YfhO family protein [Abitibacteriaceae bacterium]|nr:YfhO family protein [Abditibacteriaceae bacterium]
MSSSSSLLQQFRQRWPFLALAGVMLLFFWPYFILDFAPYSGDTAFVFVPFHRYIVERLIHGDLPLWNPYLFGGIPAMAEPQYQSWYLPNLLALLTGVPRAVGWLMAFHVLGMGSGTYLFTRRSLNLMRPAALIAALVFALGGCVQSRLINAPYIEAAAWIPWILLAYDYARLKGGAALLWPGALMAQQLCTGAPQYTYYTLLLLPAYHLYRVWGRRHHNSAHDAAALANSGSLDSQQNGRKLAKVPAGWLIFIMAIGLMGLLDAVQLLPQFELASLSARGLHATYAFIVGTPMPARHYFMTLLFPKFWGLFSSMPLDGYIPSVEMGYLGVLSLGLIVAAIIATHPRHVVWFWLLVAGATFILALGDNTPLYHLLYGWVPGFASFRTPAHWLIITTFAAAMLAGFGMQSLLGEKQQARLAARVGLGTSIILVGLGIVILVSPFGASAFQTPQTPYGPWGQIILLALSVACFIPYVFPQRFATSIRWLPAAMLILLTVDLFAVSQDMEMQHTVPVETLEAQPSTVTRLKAAPVAERFWSPQDTLPLEEWQIPGAQFQLSPLEFRTRNAPLLRGLMPSCLAAEFQMRGLTGAWGALMPLRRHAQPIYEANTDWPVKLRWLRLLNVRHYLALRELAQPQLQLESGEQPLIYRDPQALPRAFMVGQANWVDGIEAVQKISGTGFDPHQTVLLERNAEALPTPTAPTATGVMPFTPAQLLADEPEHVVMNVQSPGDGYLVLMDSPFPGWHAQVDGQDKPLQVANWVGRGVAVPAGQHQVEMWFEPPSVRLGLFISLLCLGFTVAFAVANWGRLKANKSALS